jgi:hypothetical protein
MDQDCGLVRMRLLVLVPVTGIRKSERRERKSAQGKNRKYE